MQKGLFKWVEKRYNAVDKKITKFDKLRSDSPQRLLPPVWKCGKRNAEEIKNKQHF